MNASPLPFPGGLDYPESEPVQLDISAIVARGTRLRRNRLVTKAAAVAMVVGVVPAAITITRLELPAGQSARSAARVAGSGMAGPGSTGGYGKVANAPANPAAADPASGVRPAGSGNPDSGTTFGAKHGSASTASQTRRSRLRLTVKLPAGYGTVFNLAGNQAGGGAWLWSENSREVRLFRISPAGQLTSWPVAPLTGQLVTGTSAGFAVNAAGVAWLGLNRTLIMIDTKTGKVRSWTVPAPRRNPAARSYLPADRRQTTPPYITALGISPAGDQVAVAMDLASSVPELNVRTGRFSQIPLPSRDDEPLAAGFARTGTLGIGYQQVGAQPQSGVLLVPPAGPRIDAAVTESYGVEPYRATGLIVGTSLPELVSGTGQVRPLYRPVKEIDLNATAMSPAPLPGQRLATLLPQEILVFPDNAASIAKATARSAYYLLPVVKCGSGTQSPSGSRATAQCRMSFGQFSTDAAGDVWGATESSPPTVVRLLLPGASR
jgi:hypothetical protein